MEQLIDVILNPSRAIRHVHCCSLAGSGNHFALKRSLLALNNSQEVKNCLIVTATCKYATSLPLLLQDLAEGRFKKDKCKNIDDFMGEMGDERDRLNKKFLILAIFSSEDLHNIGTSSLSAFLSIPSVHENVRILTVSEAPWGFSEYTESPGSSQPVELFLQFSSDTLEKELVTCVADKTGLEKSLVNFVVSTVFAHIQDERLIAKICSRVNQLQEKETFSSEREKMNYFKRKVPEIMNDMEARILLKHGDEKANEVQLPLLDQLLLLASFCATHNSTAGDKRFFVTHHGREKRNEDRERAVELAAEQKENGPKAADVQRIGFLFQVFLQKFKAELERDKKLQFPANFNLLPQLASLENTSQILRSSSYANVDQPKIKCMISMESAKKIAKNLEIDLENYLERRV